MTEELHWFVDFAIVGVFAMGFVAFFLGTCVGFLHRSYAQTRVPFYAPIIVGLGAVGLWLNTASSLIMFVGGVSGEVTEPVVLNNIELNILTAVVAGTTAYAGGRVGDHLAPALQLVTDSRPARKDMSTVVKTAGRVIRVTIPEKIASIEGYDPVTDETKKQLAGQEWIFPRGLTVVELRERIINRLRDDYYVGYVDIEINEDADISYLALGRRVAGIGPTLPPSHSAIALTANPPPSSSPGDLVQIWELPNDDAVVDTASSPETMGETVVDVDDSTISEDESNHDVNLPAVLRDHPEKWYRPASDQHAFAVRTPDGDRRYRNTADAAADLLTKLWELPLHTDTETTPESLPVAAQRICRGELRSRSGDVATVMVEQERIADLDQSKEYRLVTVPSNRHPEKEFASLLRAANESMETVVIEADSDLETIPIGAIRPSVVSIQPPEGDIEALPRRFRQCTVGDTLYAIGRPDQLRKLSEAAQSSPVTIAE